MLLGSEVAAGTGAPFSPVVGGVARPQGHATVMRVEDRGESERPTVMVGIRIATLSDAKAGRLPLGFRSRENLANRPNRIGR
jgi:hypothetical protein